MANNSPSKSLLKKFGLNIPDADDSRPIDKATQARVNAEAKEKQSKDPYWKKFGRNAVDSVAGAARGILGVDPSEDESWIGKKTNLGMQALDAALPMAVPRHLANSAFRIGNILKREDPFEVGNLSREYKDLLGSWTSGSAMFSRKDNLEYAENLRKSPDTARVQQKLRELLQSDTVPLFRGTAGRYNKGPLDQWKSDLSSGDDPGVRSFSMEPKITRMFADVGTSRKPREHGGYVYRADAPIESILGYGMIPDQKELIVDLSKIDPKNARILRGRSETKAF